MRAPSRAAPAASTPCGGALRGVRRRQLLSSKKPPESPESPESLLLESLDASAPKKPPPPESELWEMPAPVLSLDESPPKIELKKPPPESELWEMPAPVLGRRVAAVVVVLVAPVAGRVAAAEEAGPRRRPEERRRHVADRARDLEALLEVLRARALREALRRAREGLAALGAARGVVRRERVAEDALDDDPGLALYALLDAHLVERVAARAGDGVRLGVLDERGLAELAGSVAGDAGGAAVCAEIFGFRHGEKAYPRGARQSTPEPRGRQVGGRPEWLRARRGRRRGRRRRGSPSGRGSTLRPGLRRGGRRACRRR